MKRETQSKPRLRYLFSFLLILLIAGTAQAQFIVSTEYGNGWMKECYDDESWLSQKCAYSNHPTYLRWDNQWIPAEWLNIENGNWSYLVTDYPQAMMFSADNATITIPKANTKFDLSIFKVSPSLTYSKTVLLNNMVNVNATVAYVAFPYSISQIKDYATEHEIKVGRWMFRAGADHIEIFDDTLVNHTFLNETGEEETYLAVTTLNKSAYQFRIVDDEIRLYFLKAEANKMSGNITFALKSWEVGEGGNAWSGNASFNNFMYRRDKGTIGLPTPITDGLVLYLPMDGSSGITSYDMNLTSNNNGVLTNMNQGLDNGTSGWNSTQCKYGNCISFDGTDDYILVSNSTTLNPNIITMAFDFNCKDFSLGRVGTISKWNANSYPGWGIEIGDTISRIYIAGLSVEDWNVPISFSTNTWYNFVLTYNGTIKKIYRDGVLIASEASTGDITVSSFPVRIGDTQVSNGVNHYFPGLIDNVMIFDHALTNDEINLTMINTMATSDILTTWHDSGTGNETYAITINATSQADSNYSVDAYNNVTGAFLESLGTNLTGNQTLIPTIKVQDYKINITLYGNGTTTSDVIKTTFWTQTATGEPPAEAPEAEQVQFIFI